MSVYVSLCQSKYERNLSDTVEIVDLLNQLMRKASMLRNNFPSRDEVLAVVTLIMVIGSLTIAVIDEKSRPQFMDLTKFAVGTCIGLLIPRSKGK
jgi:hypothetical protein